MYRWITIGLVVLAIVTVVFIALLAIFPDFRVAVRDISIVILAAFQMIGAILAIAILITILWAVRTIDRLVRNTIIPRVEMLNGKLDQVIDNTRSITGNVKDTTTTVSTTTSYVADQVVAPVIRVTSLMAGVRAAAGYLARRGAPPERD